MSCSSNRISEQPYNGLKNQGATCYLNSVLQCLYMTEAFRREVESFTIDPPTTDEESIALMKELQKLFKMLKEHNGTTEGITRCLDIYNIHEQKDVVEYYQKLMDMITPQLNKIFMVELKTSTKCSSKHKQERKRPIFCIPLPINLKYNEVFSVAMGIKDFLREEKLCEDNQIYCDLCEQKAEAVTWTEIETFPTILTLNLKRFHSYYMRLEKNHCPIKISLQLEFENHTKYELYAVINHMGTENGGHYNAVIKSFEDNEWYSFDDSFVNKVQGIEESLQCSQLAYLLMYRKMDDSYPYKSTNFTTNAGQTRVPPPGYHTADLNRGQRGNYEQPKSPTCVMEEDNQSAMHFIAIKSSDTAIKGNDISNTPVLNVPLPDLPSHQMGNLDKFKKLPNDFQNTVQSLEAKVENNTETLNFLSGRGDEVSGRDNPMVLKLLNRVEALEKENSMLRDKCEKLDANKRRCNLQVTGIQEKQGEDIRQILIDLFGKVSPDIADQLSYTLDIAYRVGRNSPKPRIIVQFLSCNVRDKIWRDAKNAVVLKKRKVRIYEDFTPSTRAARKKLWPLVEQARKEGKRASLKDQYAYIDGKRISAKDFLV